MDSRISETAFNQARYPVLDRNGRPFTPGCRVRFRAPYHYINTSEGAGTVVGINPNGTIAIESDEPWPPYGGNGKNRRVSCGTRFQYSGPFRGCALAQTYVGDPFEHGQTECFVEVLEES